MALNLDAIAEWLGFPVLIDQVYGCPHFPIDGHRGTGAGVAERGSLCVDEPTGQLWIQANRIESPTWLAVGKAKIERVGAEPEESAADSQAPEGGGQCQSVESATVTSGSPPSA